MKKNLTPAVITRIRPTSKREEIADAGAKGLYLIVQESGAKSWAMRFRRLDGKPAKLTLGTFNSGTAASGAPVIGGPLTLAEARAIAGEVNRKRASGIDVISEVKTERHRRLRTNAGETNAFAEVARSFIENHKVKKTGARPRGWRDVAKILGLDYPKDGGEPTIADSGLCERWESKPIGDITGHDVHEVILEAIDDGIPGIEPKTEVASDNRGRKMADALGGMFKWAMRHKRLAMKSNPMIGVFRPAPPPARDRVLSQDEIKALWNACDELSYPFGNIIKLLLLTGCRLNEVAGLEWKELTSGFSSISLPSRRTKNALPHVVHLAPLAKKIIENAKRVEKCPYVFTTTGSTPVSGWSKVKERLDATMSERNDGEPLLSWRLHDLRRTCATLMSEELRVPPHIVEAALNHVSGAKAGVAGTYNRALYLEERAAALKRWAAYVETTVSGKPANVISIAKGRKQ